MGDLIRIDDLVTVRIQRQVDLRARGLLTLIHGRWPIFGNVAICSRDWPGLALIPVFSRRQPTLGPLAILPGFGNLTASPGGSAIRSLGPVFIRSQPSIAIRVQFSQGRGSLRNLIRIDHAILIGVQDREDRGGAACLTRRGSRPILGLNQTSNHEKCVGKSGHDGLPCSMIAGETSSCLLRSDPSGLTQSICRLTRQESRTEPE
ncbi:MAG TPA: hypothetical protein VJ486_10630 [Geothrix sp.]|nr:hypothetical protein [Geothrix sp.]